MADDAYDEYDATVRVPRGEHLAKSRDTPGAHRGFIHGGDRRMEHAEIFLKEPGEEASYVDPDPDPAPAPRTREQEELDELLRLLVLLGIRKAVETLSPLVRRWWEEQALPFFVAGWKRLLERRRAARQVRAGEAGEVTEAAVARGQEKVAAALDEYESSITSEEARAHFVEALVARRFADDKLRLLAHARIEDSNVPAELVSGLQALTPQQVQDALMSLLAARPTLVTDLEVLLLENRGKRQLGTDAVKKALKMTADKDH